MVEPLSLDEAYLDVTDNLSGASPPRGRPPRKYEPASCSGDGASTASAGVSLNKFLAKLASDRRKPNGQFAIMPDEAEAFVAGASDREVSWRRVRRPAWPGCTRLALRQARICGVKPSTSCVRGSAKRAIGTLKSHVAETIVRFNPTGSENLRGRRRPSRRI